MEPVPSDRRGIVQVALVLLAGALGTALVAGLLWYVYRPDTVPRSQSRIEPAEETSSAAPATRSVTASETTGSAPATTTPAPGVTRAEKIAFRLGGVLYVAGEDGSAAQKLVNSAEGPYSLSPDGTMLATVSSGRLTLVDTRSGSARAVGAAEAAQPVWAPDSSALYFVRLTGGSAMKVWRAGRDGTGARMQADGSAVAVSPDGRTVVTRTDAGGGSGAAAVYVSVAGGAFEPITITGQPTAVGVTNDRVLIGAVDASGRSSLLSAAFDGSGVKVLAGAPAGSGQSVWGELVVAPGGASVAAVAVGDDGFSRVSVIDVAKGGETRLTRRRDGYVRGWSADGLDVFLIEGNYFQGEPTTLVRMSANGTNRQAVVTGAQ